MSGIQNGFFAFWITAWMLVKYAGLTQRQASTFLHIDTGGAISIRIGKAKQEHETKRSLRSALRKIEKSRDGIGGL